MVCDLINIGLKPGEEKASALPVDIKIISQRMTKTQVILKLMQLEDEAVLDYSFKAMWPTGSPEDLELIRQIRKGRDLTITQEMKRTKDDFVEVVKKKGDKMSDIFHSFGDMLGGGGKSSGTTTPQKSAVTPVNNKQQTAGKHQPGK